MILSVILLTAVLAADPDPAPPDASSSSSPSTGLPAGDDALSSGLAAFRSKQFARAEADFEKAVEANPKSAAAHYYLGYSIYKTVEKKRPFHPDKQKAAAEFQKAYELDPEFRPDWGRTLGAAAPAPALTRFK